MSLINSTFVIAVHDEIFLQTGVGRVGCHVDKLESVGVVSGNGKYSTLRIFTPTSFNDIQHGIFA
jgi:hypothetical protein